MSRHRALMIVVLVVAALVLGLTAAWRMYASQYWKDRLPAELGQVSIKYLKADESGFGPGGHGAGIVVYEFHDDPRKLPLKAWVEQPRPGGVPSRDQRWRYDGWRSTPVMFDKRWTRQGDNSCGPEPGIGAYIDYGSLRCEVDPAVVARINRLLSRPGSYYAYGSAGSLIIVIPHEKLVVLGYNG